MSTENNIDAIFKDSLKILSDLIAFKTVSGEDNSALINYCEDILKKSGVALLPGSDFGFKPNKMLARLSYTDFDGKEFLKNVNGSKKLDNDVVKKYAPNVVEGTKRLADWYKNL